MLRTINYMFAYSQILHSRAMHVIFATFRISRLYRHNKFFVSMLITYRNRKNNWYACFCKIYFSFMSIEKKHDIFMPFYSYLDKPVCVNICLECTSCNNLLIMCYFLYDC